MNTLEGNLIAKGLKIGIVGARFNEFITSKLISGAMDALVRHDVKEEDVDVAWVPGAFEIPLVAKKMAESGKYDAVICLGAVIRGSSGEGHRACFAGYGCTGYVRHRYHGHHRASHRARRHEGGQQGLRLRDGCY